MGKRNEVVIARIACRTHEHRWIGVHRGVEFEARDELSCAGLVEPATELRAERHTAKFGDELRTGDDVKAIVDPRAEDSIRRGAGGADQDRDENARIDDDTNHPPSRRSRREAASSS